MALPAPDTACLLQDSLFQSHRTGDRHIGDVSTLQTPPWLFSGRVQGFRTNPRIVHLPSQDRRRLKAALLIENPNAKGRFITVETGTGEEDDSAFLPRGTVQTPSFHDGLASLLSRGDERQTWKDGGTHSVMLLLMVKIHWTRLVNTAIVVAVFRHRDKC